MNSESWNLIKQLLPETYVQQANNAANSRENIIREFLQHVNIYILLILKDLKNLYLFLEKLAKKWMER